MRCSAFRCDSVSRRLWNGSWGSGSITVNGISDCALLAFYPENANTPMLAYIEKGTAALRGSGCWITASGYTHVYTFDCTRNGDSLTMNVAKESVIGDGSYELIPVVIGSVWRIL